MTHHPGNNAIISAEQLSSQLGRFDSDNTENRLVEVNINPDNYNEWHIPGAVEIDWWIDVKRGTYKKLVDRDEIESLAGRLGITPETSIVFYGDNNNWFAAHAYWAFKYYGHDDVKLLDGGRQYWESQGNQTTTERPDYTEQEYFASGSNEDMRAYKTEVAMAMKNDTPLIDVRGADQYRGEAQPQRALEKTDRQGHIPGAKNISWEQAVTSDGRFKRIDELENIYKECVDNNECISYCGIGERASITWFVCNELLGIDVRNYDGSFIEWEADENAPVETVPADNSIRFN
jgi:Rhodanese-related sulfurtransferase